MKFFKFGMKYTTKHSGIENWKEMKKKTVNSRKLEDAKKETKKHYVDFI